MQSRVFFSKISHCDAQGRHKEEDLVARRLIHQVSVRPEGAMSTLDIRTQCSFEDGAIRHINSLCLHRVCGSRKSDIKALLESVHLFYLAAMSCVT